MNTEITVGIIMGSDSDFEVMHAAAEVLDEFGISNEVRVTSAHRDLEGTLQYAKSASSRGIKVIIAGAGGAAHLPGVVAAATPLPVIGVPIPLAQLDGMDSLLSIVQMPSGIPVATVGIGSARNAGLLAVRILSTDNPTLQKAVEDYQSELAQAVAKKDANIQKHLTKIIYH